MHPSLVFAMHLAYALGVSTAPDICATPAFAAPQRDIPSPIVCLCESKNGRYIAAARLDGHVAMWRTADRHQLIEANAHSIAYSISFLGQEQCIVVTRNGTVFTINRASGKLSKQLPWAQSPASFGQGYKDGRLVILGTHDGRFHIYRSSDWSLQSSFALPQRVDSAVISPDGRRLATDDGRSDVSIYELPSLRRLAFGRGASFWGGITGGFSNDGNCFACSGAVYEDVFLWSSPSKRLRRVWGGLLANSVVALAPDGKIIARSDTPGYVQLLHVVHGSVARGKFTSLGKRSNLIDPEIATKAMAFSPSGRSLLLGRADGAVVALSVRNGSRLTYLAN